MGAGILPVSLHNNKLYFLLGLERDDYIADVRGYCDFGGASDNNENNQQTAIRECFEETNGILDSKENLTNKLTSSLILKLSSKSYTIFLLPYEYSTILVNSYNSNYDCIKEYHPEIVNNNCLFEKKRIQWFSEDDLQDQNIEYRNFFKKEFIPLIISNLDNIKSFQFIDKIQGF